MSLGKRRQKVLDGKDLFMHYYVRMGDGRSHNKLARYAAEKWGKNPETGRIWTTGAVWQACWRWAFENLEEAKAIYKNVYRDYFLKVKSPEEVWSDEDFEKEWKETVARFAHTCMSASQYRRFLGKNPEFQPYEVMDGKSRKY